MPKFAKSHAGVLKLMAKTRHSSVVRNVELHKKALERLRLAVDRLLRLYKGDSAKAAKSRLGLDMGGTSKSTEHMLPELVGRGVEEIQYLIAELTDLQDKLSSSLLARPSEIVPEKPLKKRSLGHRDDGDDDYEEEDDEEEDDEDEEDDEEEDDDDEEDDEEGVDEQEDEDQPEGEEEEDIETDDDDEGDKSPYARYTL